MTTDDQKTHFGYETVTPTEKTDKVRSVFNSVAKNYDVMNDLMSFGIHRIWKKFTVDFANVKTGDYVLDLAGGTGDLTSKFVKQVGQDGQVILADINYEMLNEGRNRLINENKIKQIQYAQVNAECLPFADNTFDLITMAFGLRNVTFMDKALTSMYRVLKPGGKLLVLEFSKPTLPGLAKIYDWYSFNIIPKIGKLVAADSESYQYLAESIRMHPNQTDLKNKILQAGFEECEFYNLSAGIVALHTAYKY